MRILRHEGCDKAHFSTGEIRRCNGGKWVHVDEIKVEEFVPRSGGRTLIVQKIAYAMLLATMNECLEDFELDDEARRGFEQDKAILLELLE